MESWSSFRVWQGTSCARALRRFLEYMYIRQIFRGCTVYWSHTEFGLVDFAKQAATPWTEYFRRCF